MGVSSLIALLGIGLATFIWLQAGRDSRSRAAAQFPGLHRLLLNKYYVDEVYDAAIVQPIKTCSEEGLWRGMDVRVVDGAVNGTRSVVGGDERGAAPAADRLGRSYAASTFVGRGRRCSATTSGDNA